jgi:hypothetical protein
MGHFHFHLFCLVLSPFWSISTRHLPQTTVFEAAALGWNHATARRQNVKPKIWHTILVNAPSSSETTYTQWLHHDFFLVVFSEGNSRSH